MRRRPAAAALAVVTAVLATLTALATASPAGAATAPLTPVAKVDTARYLGSWYQLAAVPAVYEVQCSKNVKAAYSLNPDGTVAVRNTCVTWFGTTSTVDGTAKIDNAPRNSALTVSFFSFAGKPVYGSTSNYLVFGLDPQYRWALVGDPDRQSGFVLSRTPTLSAAAERTVRASITAAGYDLCRFRYTAQDGGQGSRGSVC